MNIQLPLNTTERHNITFLNRMIEDEKTDGFTPKDFRTTAINNEIANALVNAGVLISATGEDGRTKIYIFNDLTPKYLEFLECRFIALPRQFSEQELIWAQLMGNDVTPYLLRLFFTSENRDRVVTALGNTVTGLAIKTSLEFKGGNPSEFYVSVEDDYQHVGGKLPSYIVNMLNEISERIGDEGVGGKHGGAIATNTDSIVFCVAFTSMMMSRLNDAVVKVEV